jgi:hypothetical protein
MTRATCHPLFLVCILVTGCASSGPPIGPLPAAPVIVPLFPPDSPGPSPRLAVIPDPTVIWKPKFITTGFSTGLMVEYLHLQHSPGKQRRAVLDAWGYFSQQSPLRRDKSTESDSLSATAFLRITAAVNGLGQAFFSLRPGRYMLRQVSPWAEQIYTREVIVREGAYSIVIFHATGDDADSS